MPINLSPAQQKILVICVEFFMRAEIKKAADMSDKTFVELARIRAKLTAVPFKVEEL